METTIWDSPMNSTNAIAQERPTLEDLVEQILSHPDFEPEKLVSILMERVGGRK